MFRKNKTQYSWADDNVDENLISVDICPEHTTNDLNNLVSELKNAYMQHSSIFPLYIRNFCHHTLTHLCEIRMAGMKKTIKSYEPQLLELGFVHSTDTSIQMSYSFNGDAGNCVMCMFDRTFNPRKHRVIIFRVSMDKINDCKNILIDIAKNLES